MNFFFFLRISVRILVARAHNVISYDRFAQVARSDIDIPVHAGHGLRAHAGLDPVPAAVRLAAGGRVRDVPPVLRVRARAQVGAARGPGHRRARGRLFEAGAVDERVGRVQDPEEAAVPGQRGPQRGPRVGHHALRAAVRHRAVPQPGRHRRLHGHGPQTGPAAPAPQANGVPVTDIRTRVQHEVAVRQKRTGESCNIKLYNINAVSCYQRLLQVTAFFFKLVSIN